MRRRLTGLFLMTLLMVGSIAGALVFNASAQEATPPAEEAGFPTSFELAPGVVADSMLFAEGSEAPSSYRLHFDPGVVYAVMPSPSLDLGYMETGSLVMTLDSAVTIGRVGDTEATGDSIPAGTEFVLEEGEFIVLQPGASGEIRNDSDQTATLSVAGLTPADTNSPEATPAG